jgi:hypothetical protein
MPLGEPEQLLHQRPQELHGSLTAVADVHGEVGRHLVVARPRRVQLAPQRADDLRQAALDGHVDVLVAVGKRERSLVQLTRHGL